MSSELIQPAETTWLPANAPIPAAVTPGLAIARIIAVENPKQLFEQSSYVTGSDLMADGGVGQV